MGETLLGGADRGKLWRAKFPARLAGRSVRILPSRSMEIPEVRPGVVHEGEAATRVLAYFFNAAHGNSVIQFLTALGIPNDQLGVTPPERIEGGQGMVLAIPCADEAMLVRVESLCRTNGAQVHRRRV